MKKYAFILAVFLLTLIPGGCATAPSDSAFSATQLSAGAQKLQWHDVKTGMSYTSLTIPLAENENREVLVAKVDPKLFQFHIYANPKEEKAKTIREIHKEKRSVLTFNGAFFDENFKPIGLLVDGDKTYHRASKADLLNGIFMITKGGQAKLVRTEDYNDSADTEFALQNGPILIDGQGEIQMKRDTGKVASRTALALDKDGNIVLIILKQSFFNTDNVITLYQFAHLLREARGLSGLGLHSVLNLDGGPSSGAVIGDQYFAELAPIQNAVIVVKR